MYLSLNTGNVGVQADAQSCTAERAPEAVAGREDAAVCTQAATPLVPCWEVAQAAVALRAPLTPAALGPFGLMLLSVAVLPLWRPHWWDDNANRLKVLLDQAFCLIPSPKLTSTAACAMLHTTDAEYRAKQPQGKLVTNLERAQSP